jgi:hypothetical protein
MKFRVAYSIFWALIGAALALCAGYALGTFIPVEKGPLAGLVLFGIPAAIVAATYGVLHGYFWGRYYEAQEKPKNTPLQVAIACVVVIAVAGLGWWMFHSALDAPNASAERARVRGEWLEHAWGSESCRKVIADYKQTQTTLQADAPESDCLEEMHRCVADTERERAEHEARLKGLEAEASKRWGKHPRSL